MDHLFLFVFSALSEVSNLSVTSSIAQIQLCSSKLEKKQPWMMPFLQWPIVKSIQPADFPKSSHSPCGKLGMTQLML